MTTKQITSRNKAQTKMGVSYSALVIAIFFILSFNLISAAQPIPLVNTGTDGLQIFYPEYDTVKQGESFTLHVHVGNLSNGYEFPPSEYDCYLHLYGIDGNHILQQQLEEDTIEEMLYIDGGNFSELGTYVYYIHCNTTTLGGSVKGIYLVTPTGLSDNNNLIFSLFIIIFIFGITLLGLYTRNEVMTMIGGMGLLILSVYIHQSGIIIFRNTLTTFIGYLTLALGVVATFSSAYELWENNR